MKYPIVYLEWCDAISNDISWHSLEDALKWGEKNDWVVKQTGFVLKETKTYILFASRVNFQNGEYESLGGLFKLPKTWIMKRVNLKLK